MSANTAQKGNVLLFAQLTIALGAVFGSLFFSEIMKFPPCDLCWYQRIFMYPFVLIALVGLYIQSQDTHKFLAPFAWIGLGISVYHNLIYYKIIQVIVPCSESAPCTAQQLNYMGFITIPLLSILAFLALTTLNTLALLLEKKGTYEK